jgi:hypothetical protein
MKLQGIKIRKLKKILFSLMLINLLLASAGIAQVQNKTTSQSCIQFLDDFVPNSTDSVLTVRIKVHLFEPALNPSNGYWSTVTQPIFDTLIARANKKLRTIAVDNLNYGAAYINNTKMQVELAGFYRIQDDSAYYKPQRAYDFLGYDDEGKVCVYLGHIAATDWNAATVNSKFITLRAETNRNFNTDFDYYSTVFAHEILHSLGLRHTTFNQITWIKPPGVACTGCDSIYVDDFFFETPPWSNDSCGTPGASNNFLSQNGGCNQYLSPRQMAAMHYNLRTNRNKLLTTKSYYDATTVNHSYDTTLMNSETWIIPRYFKGNVTIPSGKVITIKCLVGMTHKGKIIIKSGGKLILDGGVLTNISGRLWEGIDVEGDPTVPQNGSYPWTNQGQLHIINGGTIENSINGVRNYGHNSDGSQNFASTGGIIIANHAKFINNVRDVEFLSYPIAWPVVSRFDLSEFRTTAAINDNNAPYVHVSLWNIKGVQFNGCVFENAAQTLYPNVGQGIHSIDAIYTVNDYLGTPTQFKNFNQGISVSNFNPLRPVNIYESYFENNLKGVEMSSVKGQIIEGNTFSLSIDYAHGVDLTNCNNYTIGSNTITGGAGVVGPVGTYAVSSGAGTHRIFRNQFSNLSMGVCAQFNNSGPTNNLDGLMMNCNRFNIGTANNYDIVMLGANTSNAAYSPSVARFQGVISDPLTPNAAKLVRNQYGAACSGINPQKKWWINAGTKQVVHAANSETVTRPENCSSSLLNIINSGISLDFGSHCSSAANRPSSNEYCECPKCCLLDDINLGLSNALTESISEGANYFSLIDGGDTQNLINLINDPTKSSSDLQTALAAASPYVSDSVLKLFFNNLTVSVADAQSIHNLNKPVTEVVWNTILDLDYSVSEMEVFADQQDDELYSERSYLEGKYSSAYANLQSIYAEKLTYYLQDTLKGAKDTVITLLAKNIGNLPDAKVQLVNAYANGGYYTRAFSYADSLSGFDEFEEIMELEIALLKLDTAKNKIFKILDDATLRGTIMEFAADSTKEGSWQARAVLNKVYGTDMHFLYLVPEESGGSRIGSIIKEDGGINTSEEYLKVFPNPTEGKFNLYYASASKEPARLSIVDMLGKEIINTEIKPNQKQEYESALLGNGIYFVVIKQNDKVVHNKKLIILK